MAAPHLRAPVLDVGCGARAPLSTRFRPGEYIGVEPKRRARDRAERLHSGHRFLLPEELPQERRFASVAALAVLEHVSDAGAFLSELASHLEPGGTLVLTTPHPIGERVHRLGSRVGVFSSRAAEEHEHLYDRDELFDLLERVALRVQLYRRFMLGMNQLVVASGSTS